MSGVSYLNLYLVALLSLLHLPVPVPQLSLALLLVSFSDLPEGVDLVPLQLKIVPLLSLSVQLLPKANNVLLQLPLINSF